MKENEQKVMEIYNKCINRKREHSFAAENDGRYFVHTDDYMLSSEELQELQQCFDVESISIAPGTTKELILVVIPK